MGTITPVIKFYIAVARVEALDMAWRASGLVANEQGVLRIAQHDFQVVDDAAAGTYTDTSGNDRGLVIADRWLRIF